MSTSLDHVQTAFEIDPPDIKPWLISGLRSVLPLWLRWQCGITEIEDRYIDRLIDLIQKMNKGKVRCLIAFRHPTIDDQFALFHLFAYSLPKAAKKQGTKFAKSPHCYYVYDRGIPLWAGKHVAWLYPRTGGIPISRGKLDRDALRMIRHYIVNGEYPVVISPEGGTNNHNELVNPLEPGVAQMGFWAAEDLEKAGRDETVVILPVGVQYEYLGAPWEQVDQFLMQLESDCGISKPALRSPTMEERYERLYGLGEYLLDEMGQHYQKYYAAYAPEPKEIVTKSAQATSEVVTATKPEIADRLPLLLDHMLRVAEAHFKIKPKGTFIDRCRRLEAAGFEQIFRTDIDDLNSISPLEKGLADHLAKEANSSQWHMRIAETLTAISGNYIKESPTPTRFADVLQQVWRAVARVKSQTFGRPPYLGDRKCTISIGEPISISDRYAEYKSDRQNARRVVNDVTCDLQHALEGLIFPSK
ncbi:phospholipid/glycerol acyltransferase [Thalassoporum mexicanum PCC 7367]|uniref:1-acyl-sn-glycerol-3-phosphate acyltransferase n=1 Tax=Thalassoporum mexicanum TaxID=3457544 RepID=UPI00029FED32|nr:1-acyl-sn-glycerol-3-phosphate acyltransferase [Pseudanabaena sp. PCC 7367]AFY71579.1 phospholipid/glycerol acyltransferase [Pseudanabaena sp. PCC 7367]